MESRYPSYLPGRYLGAWSVALLLLGVSLVTTETNGIVHSWKTDETSRKTNKDLTSDNRQTYLGLTVSVRIDVEHPIGPISPLIYGMAMPTDVHYKELGVPVARWGGNPNSRYNWEKGNCWNSARDWKFANGNYGKSAPAQKRPSGVADQFIAEAHKRHATCLLTIPTLGWVARDDDMHHMSLNVPEMGGVPVVPGSDAIAGYDPTLNRTLVSIRSLPHAERPFRDPPDLQDETIYQDEWIAHLKRKFGPSGHGGVEYYAIDNEPDLWDTTHTDMHPVSPDYTELRDQFITYADAIKQVDPEAKISGPVLSGWLALFFAPRDRGTDRYSSHGDRRMHRNMPFLPWFLQEVAHHDRKIGHRTLDYLDVHYYPQGDGIYAGKTDQTTNNLRLRSTRSLWDPDYRDESWVDARIQLIPRLRQWIKQYYPGTSLALTEWNWGAEQTINGGLAVAEVLGILGREQVDMACYWTAPPVGSPAFFAFKMYQNADERGHGIGHIALPTLSEAPERISCYATITQANSTPSLISLMLINKSPYAESIIPLDMHARPLMRSMEWAKQEDYARDDWPREGTIQGFRYSAEYPQRIVRLNHVTTTPPNIRAVRDTAQTQEQRTFTDINQGKIVLPPNSITLLRFQNRVSANP